MLNISIKQKRSRMSGFFHLPDLHFGTGLLQLKPPIGFQDSFFQENIDCEFNIFPVLWSIWKKIQIKPSVWSERECGRGWCQVVATCLVAIHTHLWELSSTLLLSSDIHQQQKKMIEIWIKEESKCNVRPNDALDLHSLYEHIPDDSGWILPTTWVRRWRWD